MKSSIVSSKKHGLKMLILAMGICISMIAGSERGDAASCMDIADIPMDAIAQKAPGMIMFVLDDSGSMDWSTMCPPAQESGGVFKGYEYIFSNPGDHVYSTSSSNGNILENSAGDRMLWMSQWSGYNGMYYDPATVYTHWPTLTDADPDSPRSHPMNSGNTLDMTTTWHMWESGAGTIVDNSDSTGFASSTGWSISTSGGQNGSYLYASNGAQTYSATWTASNLDTSTTYNVYARWMGGGTSRLTAVHYRTHDDTVEVADTSVNQQENHNEWMLIAENISFSTGTGVVKIEETTGTSGMCADAVKFVPTDNPISDIARRHYYVRSDSGTYLVNLIGGVIEYYHVNLTSTADNRESVTADKLVRLTEAEAEAAGIVTGRTYTEEIQNFANWYSFYRRRELTAVNAIANVIDTIDGVYVGIISINNQLQQRVLPVRVTLDNTFVDQSGDLLNTLYNLTITSKGTPLRNGLKAAGEFFRGNYLKPTSFSDQTDSNSYPYFKAEKGGSCQQAFTILFTDGYYNGSDPGVGNADGDGNTEFDGTPFSDGTSNTLADVAMYYYERDLNTDLGDYLPDSQTDPAQHQHMVTYTIAFGVNGSLNTELYKDCPLVEGACPASWPSTSSDNGKIDDMFHAAVNGRGSYLAANSSAELNAALKALQDDIGQRLGSAAAVATNSIQRTVGSVIYQGVYSTANWFGELRALPLDVATGHVGDPQWLASDHVPDWDQRNIFSYNGASGIVFDAANMTDAQKALLTGSGLGTAVDIVNFIRGDQSKDTSNGGSFRKRTQPIGDIVHSAPTYHDGAVYVGSNDGMLHALDATNGHELFTYVPNLVYDHLADLADPDYTHKFYVDGNPTVAKVDDKAILVSGLGKGGKGYFALDVTDPKTMAAANVLWEYPVSGTDDDLGYTFSNAYIVKTQAADAKNVVIFGNGYDSVNGEAVLYVLNVETGALIKQFKTGAADCNGLSTPAVADVDADGVVDYAIAGDLKGNMWKFDLRGETTADWKFSFQSGTTPMPLITVKNKSGEVQPITASPEVMVDCAMMEQGRGLMIIFGTGKYLSADDFVNTPVQSFYGIWDWSNIWPDHDTAKAKYLGTFNADRSLSNLDAGITLLEQTVTSETSEWLVLSDHQPQWYNPFVDPAEGLHMGWYFDLPFDGERSLRKPLLRMGNVFFTSTIPSSSPCEAGGNSVIYQVNACTGGRTEKPQFDLDGDKKIDDDDLVGGVPPTGKAFTTILHDPIEIEDKIYSSDNQRNIQETQVPLDRQGMFFWRVLGQ